MFRSSTIIMELALNLAKVIFMLKHSVKLRRYLLWGCVAARHAATQTLQQNSRQNRNMKISNKFFETVATFKHSLTQLADRNIVRGNTKSRLG